MSDNKVDFTSLAIKVCCVIRDRLKERFSHIETSYDPRDTITFSKIFHIYEKEAIDFIENGTGLSEFEIALDQLIMSLDQFQDQFYFVNLNKLDDRSFYCGFNKDNDAFGKNVLLRFEPTHYQESWFIEVRIMMKEE